MRSQVPLSGSRANRQAVDRATLLASQDEILVLLDSGTKLDVVLARIAAEISRFTGARCAIALVEGDSGAQRIAAAPGLTDAHRTAIEHSLAGKDAQQGSSVAHNVRPICAANAKCHSLIGHSGRVLGTIVLLGDVETDAGESEPVKMLSRLARLAIETDHSAAALRTANERFSTLAANLPGVVYQRRVDPNGEIRYTYISEGAKDLFGVSAEEILTDPKALFSTHGPSYRENFRQRLIEASRTMTIWDVEAEIITRDGKRKWTHAIARPKKLPDGAVQWDGVILDATRIARREQQLRVEKDQAELANRGKSEFIATMSHELRTPLNAIIGFSEVMQQQLLGPLGNPMYQDYCRDILESGRHLLSIINDVLDISKVEAGKLQLNEDDVELPLVVAGVLRLMRERADAGGVTLSAELADGLPIIRADERLLKQILSNLLSNAVKFTPKGGIATVQARVEGDAVVVAVKDSGIGMAPDQIPRAMERFGQVDNSLSRKFEGTGLGLPLVKAFTELHGGTFELQSQLEVGTTAIVRLPASRIVPPNKPA